MEEIAAEFERRPRLSRRVGAGASGFSLLAAAMLIAALFPPFVSQVCSAGCSGISASLGESPDAWAVLWIAGILAVTAVLGLAGVVRRPMAMLSAVAALAAVGVAVFEGVVAFPRVLGAAEFVPDGPTYALGPGYSLFLIGGVVAVGAAVVTLLADGDDESEIRRMVPALRGDSPAVGRASLCVIALACAGTFLPFAHVSCGFGCPPDTPVSAVYSGSLAASHDGWLVIALLVAAALAVAMRLSGRGTPFASIAGLVLALAATVLASVDSLNAAVRVLGWPYAIPTVPAAGYYVVQVGAALAAVLSVLLVAADHPMWGLRRRVQMTAQVPSA